jgi:hypothetical protein
MLKMIRPPKITTLCLLLLVFTLPSAAQKKINEGSITYAVSYELPPDKQQYADMLPKKIVCYFRGDSTAAIVDQGAATVKGVSVFKTDYHCLIIDAPASGKKIVVVLTPGEVAQEQAAIPQFTGKKSGGTQLMDGYNCFKVTLTDPKTNAVYDIWLTNDIDMPPTSVSRAVSMFGGVPVKFVTFNNGVKINADIKELKEQAVPPGFFTASKDYEPMSYTDLKAASGGN